MPKVIRKDSISEEKHILVSWMSDNTVEVEFSTGDMWTAREIDVMYNAVNKALKNLKRREYEKLLKLKEEVTTNE